MSDPENESEGNVNYCDRIWGAISFFNIAELLEMQQYVQMQIVMRRVAILKARKNDGGGFKGDQK